MTSLTALLSKWPLVRQIRGRKDGSGLEAMSEKTRAMHARTDDAQVPVQECDHRRHISSPRDKFRRSLSSGRRVGEEEPGK